MDVCPAFLKCQNVCFELEGVGLAGVGVDRSCVFLTTGSRASNAKLTTVLIMVATVVSSLVSVLPAVVSIVEGG